MAKLIYKPFGIVVGVLAGVLAGQAFERIWNRLSDKPPADAEDRDASFGEVAATAAIHGGVYGAVQALVRRGGAAGFERATGIWPGGEREA